METITIKVLKFRIHHRPGVQVRRRRVRSVVEHSSANPKVPGSIPGQVS